MIPIKPFSTDIELFASDETSVGTYIVVPEHSIDLVVSGENEVTLVIPSAIAGHIIQDNSVSMTQRQRLNFIGATVTDDEENNATNVEYEAEASLWEERGGYLRPVEDITILQEDVEGLPTTLGDMISYLNLIFRTNLEYQEITTGSWNLYNGNHAKLTMGRNTALSITYDNGTGSPYMPYCSGYLLVNPSTYTLTLPASSTKLTDFVITASSWNMLLFVYMNGIFYWWKIEEFLRAESDPVYQSEKSTLALKSELTKESIVGIKTADSPEFADVDLTPLALEATYAASTWAYLVALFTTVPKSIKSHLIKIWDRIYILENKVIARIEVPSPVAAIDITSLTIANEKPIIIEFYTPGAWRTPAAVVNAIVQINGITGAVYNFATTAAQTGFQLQSTGGVLYAWMRMVTFNGKMHGQHDNHRISNTGALSQLGTTNWSIFDTAVSGITRINFECTTAGDVFPVGTKILIYYE